ncbi:hypothetical protein DRN38_00055 [Thermococci archaeon]|nr:MAG: hypothetical protein DRN38_00055 [Thermococci archaeon]
MLNRKGYLDVINAFGKRSKTIYIDCYGLPDIITLGIEFKYNNYDDETLYFKIRAESESPYWSFAEAKTLGSLGSGGSAYALWDNMGQRSNPNSDLEETIKLILEAYRDSNYTELKWTFSRLVTIRFLYPPNWTIWDEDNFDAGDTEGWEGYIEQGYVHERTGVSSAYALSPPYSLLSYGYFEWGGTWDWWTRKNISVPECEEAFATLNMRWHPNGTFHFARITYAGAYKMNFSVPPPTKRWIRVTFPLTPNSSGYLQITYRIAVASGDVWNFFMDDVRFFYK